MGQVNQSRRAVSWRSGVIDQQTSLSAILTARSIGDDDFRLGACRKEFTKEAVTEALRARIVSTVAESFR
jgi:hypothetical protein